MNQIYLLNLYLFTIYDLSHLTLILFFFSMMHKPYQRWGYFINININEDLKKKQLSKRKRNEAGRRGRWSGGREGVERVASGRRCVFIQ